MNIKIAIEEIIKSTIPDSVNGIPIKTDLREVKSDFYHDSKDFNLTLMPESSDCENVAISLRICPDQFPDDTQKGSLAYDRLEYSIGDLLISYIQNIIRRTSDE